MRLPRRSRIRRRRNLAPLALHVLDSGEFERDRARRIADGAPAAQLKVVHLATKPGAHAHMRMAYVVELGDA